MADYKDKTLDHIDPVCGMSVSEDSPEQSRYEGETFHFCSKDCKDKFEMQPADYAKTVIPK
jgi:YHS domain-containing protein